jgi:hypothetical protein
MGSVFEKAIQTITGKNSYEKENAEADFKLLEAQAVASDAALSSVPAGIDQTNIRGKSVFHSVGDRMDLIDGAETLVVKKTQTHTVFELAQLLYNNTRKVVIQDNDTLTVNGRQDIFIVGKSTQQFMDTHEVTAPEEFEWKHFERGFSAFKLDTCLLDFDVHATSVDTHVVDVELAGLKTRGGALEEVIKGQKGEADAIQLEISIEVDIKGRGDVLVDIGLGTPFR